jgi:hypothetical protein
MKDLQPWSKDRGDAERRVGDLNLEGTPIRMKGLVCLAVREVPEYRVLHLADAAKEAIASVMKVRCYTVS